MIGIQLPNITAPPTLEIGSEYGRLVSVVLATPRHFRVVDPINATQEEHFAHTPPSADALVAEQAAFAAVLEGRGVEVVWAPEQEDSPFQLNTRDVGAVIASEFVAGRMRYPIRTREPLAVRDLLAARAAPIVDLPGGTFEGGDVLVDGEVVYVGLSQRTSSTGVEHLARHCELRGIRLEPVPLRDDVLHLDVVLNLVAPGIALAYPPALRAGIPEPIAQRYEVIAITDDEYARLGTNVFSLDPTCVIADARNGRIVDLLTERGLEVIAIDYRETTKIGGSFRCMTLPLCRNGVPA